MGSGQDPHQNTVPVHQHSCPLWNINSSQTTPLFQQLQRILLVPSGKFQIQGHQFQMQLVPALLFPIP
nr:hypothetical protein Iba_scaffold1522371CG0010 [Ipomoea batatas]